MLALLSALAACGDGDGPVITSLHYPAYGVAVNGSGVIAVANNGHTVRFIGAGGMDSVVTDGTPAHVAYAPSGAIAYATLQSGDALVRLRVHPTAELLRLDYGHPLWNLVVHPSLLAVYVTTADGWLFKADPTTLAKLDSIKLASGSNGIAFGPGATALYASTIFAGWLYRIDPTTLAKVDSFDVGYGAQRIVVSPGGDSVYVANEGNSTIKVVRPSTGAVSQVKMDGVAYGIALSTDGSKLYVTLLEKGTVQVLDRRDLRVLDSWNVGGTPRNVAVAPSGDFVVVSTQEDVVKVH